MWYSLWGRRVSHVTVWNARDLRNLGKLRGSGMQHYVQRLPSLQDSIPGVIISPSVFQAIRRETRKTRSHVTYVAAMKRTKVYFEHGHFNFVFWQTDSGKEETYAYSDILLGTAYNSPIDSLS
ncbi:hypothetical protein N7468_004150 [Penicillium chermesinum]|uniref:Uncharacterized protein n=1 Tax=Penicillium chermesinum TaxID=63820 RepID=A0A9W9P8L2_9EURO|nr:uncharacterized protein N7468_004150 [Penicillium chermesinum]KAJ5239531.1 hypothetical protein N7468_004150 [Penicillium chermesinum]